VDTLHTVLNRGCSIWDQTRMPEEELRRRLNQVRAGMKERDCDLLLVYGDSWKFGHLAYVSHFIPKNRGAMAIIPLDGEPALVIQEPSRNNPFSRTLTWIQETRSVGKFVQGVGDAIKARSLKPKKIALVAVEEQLNIREWQELDKLFEGVQRINLNDYLSSLRLVKSSVELSILKETVRILEEALSEFEKTATPGRKEYQVMAELERVARRRGVEDFRLLLARSSAPAVGLRPAADAAFEKGEAILIFVAASFQRYWAELGQTFCLGKPADAVTRSYGMARRTFQQLSASVAAGTAPHTVSGALTEIPSVAARESFQAYGLGNGLGLDLCEEPYLGKEEGVPIRAGMTLTLRTCFTGEEVGSALISRPFLVTKSGLEPLARSEGQLVAIGD
jgi:Xaa-Pro aminopeptidase